MSWEPHDTIWDWWMLGKITDEEYNYIITVIRRVEFGDEE